jgi:hypothetical protein
MLLECDLGAKLDVVGLICVAEANRYMMSPTKANGLLEKALYLPPTRCCSEIADEVYGFLVTLHH